MPEVEFRESKEFKGLDGQSPPKGDLLDRVFRQARFDTRFYEEVGILEGTNVTTGMQSISHSYYLPPFETR